MKTILAILALAASAFGATAGSIWRDGTGAPANSLGANNDYYLERVTGDVYRKTSGIYTKVTNIKGPTGLTGATGPVGPMGPAGPQGPAGGTTPPIPQPPTSSPTLPADAVAFASADTLGPLRNEFVGWVGHQILTGASPVVVTHLGRMMVAGNTGTHLVKLVAASTKEDVPGSSVSVVMTGGTAGKFQYTKLPAPVTLAANTDYFVITQVSNGGDFWHDHQNTKLTTTAVAACNALVWAGADGVWNTKSDTNSSHGPVSFAHVKQDAIPIPPTPVPIPPISTDMTSVKLGDKVTLTASFEGQPATSYEWRKNGALIAGATGAQYVIRSFQAADAADYRARVVNSISEAPGFMQLKVQP